MNRQSLSPRLALVLPLAAAIGLAPAAAGRVPQDVRPPNVLLIMADDMGWGDLRSHGNERIDTPVLDRLAQASTRFDRFFVSPVCAPTRASLLTGRYFPRTGVSSVTGGLETMRAGEVTLAEALRRRGYATAVSGKWHLGAHYPSTPRAQGFDSFLGFYEGHTNNYFDATLTDGTRPVPTSGYITDVLTDDAIRFMREHRGRPFFSYVAYNAPHAPYQLPDAYFDKYASRGFDPVAASIYGMVENIDTNVGRLLKTLDDLSIADRTIVVFLTDNGPQTDRFNGGMKGRKGHVDEGGVRVPLFIRAPGHTTPGTVVRRNAAHIDLMPTLLEMTGQKPAGATNPSQGPAFDGRSLVPLVTNPDASWPDRRLFTYQRRDRTRLDPIPGSVRTDRWRLVKMPAGVSLFDMTVDPGQGTDVAAAHPEVVRELNAAYEAWFTDVTRDGLVPPPIEVGHPEAVFVELPATEAARGGGVVFKGGQGWAHDWITNWTGPGDQVSWQLEAVRTGRFEAVVHYALDAAGPGSVLILDIDGEARLTAKVPAAVAPVLSRPDRQPRTEVPDRRWATLRLGAVTLDTGPHTLALRAGGIALAQGLALKGVTLRALE